MQESIKWGHRHDSGKWSFAGHGSFGDFRVAAAHLQCPSSFTSCALCWRSHADWLCWLIQQDASCSGWCRCRLLPPAIWFTALMFAMVAGECCRSYEEDGDVPMGFVMVLSPMVPKPVLPVRNGEHPHRASSPDLHWHRILPKEVVHNLHLPEWSSPELPPHSSSSLPCDRAQGWLLVGACLLWSCWAPGGPETRTEAPLRCHKHVVEIS